MGYAERRYRWEWRLRASPERLWPFVADTNRFNRDTGLPTVQELPVDGPAKVGENARRRLGYFRYGVWFEWEEEPFEWQEPYRYAVRRTYLGGPVATFRAQVELVPTTDGGTQLIYMTWIRPRNLFGLLGVSVAMPLLTYRVFGRVFRQYDELASRAKPVEPLRASHLASGGAARLARLRRQLTEQVGSADLVDHLVDEVARGDDLALAHLRPYALADAWGVPRRTVLELCLHATRLGLFDLQWDLVCPLCRGARASSTALSEIASGVHCETCNIDVTANFDRSVELTFRPSAAIRQVELPSFCVAGPRITSHVVAQLLLAPGESREITSQLESGSYRVRVLGYPGARFVRATDGGQDDLAVAASSLESSSAEALVSLTPRVRFENDADVEHLFIFERTAWSDVAATAAEVTTLQTFRDLFSADLLRPGQQISVGSLTVLFTDLQGSTSLYRRIGDAPAFGRVLDHFQILREEVDRQEGALVKTIGDSVMAVFRRPSSALQAILRAQERLAKTSDGETPLILKAGMHHGPCIAVTLNDRLDYFGSVVNFAARLQRLSRGADVVCTDKIRHDPEVAALLRSEYRGLAVERFEAVVKGFDDETFGLWRISARAGDSQLPESERASVEVVS